MNSSLALRVVVVVVVQLAPFLLLLVNDCSLQSCFAYVFFLSLISSVCVLMSVLYPGKWRRGRQVFSQNRRTTHTHTHKMLFFFHLLMSGSESRVADEKRDRGSTQTKVVVVVRRQSIQRSAMLTWKKCQRLRHNQAKDNKSFLLRYIFTGWDSSHDFLSVKGIAHRWATEQRDTNNNKQQPKWCHQLSRKQNN